MVIPGALKTFSAKNADANSLNFGGGVKRVMIGNMAEQHPFFIGGSVEDGPVSVTAGVLEGVIFESLRSLSRFTATSFTRDDQGNGSMAAPSIKTARFKQSFDADAFFDGADGVERVVSTWNVGGKWDGALIGLGSLGNLLAGAVGDLFVSAAGLVGRFNSRADVNDLSVQGHEVTNVMVRGAANTRIEVQSGIDLGADGRPGGDGDDADSQQGTGNVGRFSVLGTAASVQLGGGIFGNTVQPAARVKSFSIGGPVGGTDLVDTFVVATVQPKRVKVGGANQDPANVPFFTLSLPVLGDNSPPVIDAALSNDTGQSGSDAVTSDATVTGTIVDESAVVLEASFDGVFTDVTDTLQPDDSFTFDEGTLQTIFGEGVPLAVPDGDHTLSIRATDEANNVSDIFEIDFALDTMAPVAPAGFTVNAASDSGISDSDGITNVVSPTVDLDAESLSLVTLFDDGVEVDSAMANSIVSFVLADLSEGVHTLTATATDTAGNVSAAAQLVITIDTTVPTVSFDPANGSVDEAVPPTVAFTTALDGSSVTSGQRFDVHISANDDVQIDRVELLMQGDNVLDVDTSFPYDFSFEVPAGLPDEQPVTLTARAVDTGGNTATDTIDLTYEAVPPAVTSADPAPDAFVEDVISEITLNFTAPMNRSLAAPDDFELRRPGADGAFETPDDMLVTITALRFRTDNRSLTVTMDSLLSADRYRLNAPAAVLQDAGGNTLDGEFAGTFPTGDGVAGGDFAYTFTIVETSPVVTGATVFAGLGGQPAVLTVALNRAIDADRPQVADFTVIASGADGEFGTVDDADLPIDMLVVASLANRITLVLDAAFDVGRHRLTVDDAAIVDLAGNVLDGEFAGAFPSGDGNPGGDFVFDFDVQPPAGETLFPGPAFFNAPVDDLAEFDLGVILSADVTGDGLADVLRLAPGEVFLDAVFATPALGELAYGPAAETVLPADTTRVQIGDVNGDLANDLVVLQRPVTTDARRGFQVSRMIGNGDGTFQDAELIFDLGVDAPNANQFERQLVVADFTGSDALDIALLFPGEVLAGPPIDFVDAEVRILLGVGDGTFDAPIVTNIASPFFNQSGSEFALFPGHFNGDADLDLISSHSMLINNGDGTFTRSGIGFPGPFRISADAGGIFDATDNGIGDYVDALGERLRVYENDGSERDDLAVTRPENSQLVASADLNGDGRPDALFINTAFAGSPAIASGAAGGGFLDPVLLPVVGDFDSIATDDVNGDGAVDLLLANTGEFQFFTPHTVLLLNDGDGSFQAPVAPALGVFDTLARTSRRQFADVNGDGAVDLVGLHSPTDIVVALGDNSGRFGAATVIGTSDSTADEIRIGDLNGDDRPDVVIGEVQFSATSENIRVFINDGDGTFSTQFILASTGTQVIDIELADVNEDAVLDILFSTFTGTGMRLGLSDVPGVGNGTFDDIVPLDGRFAEILLGDFNEDDQLDFGLDRFAQFALLLGDGAGNFADGGLVTKDLDTLDVPSFVVDVNGDDFDDIIFVDSDLGLD